MEMMAAVFDLTVSAHSNRSIEQVFMGGCRVLVYTSYTFTEICQALIFYVAAMSSKAIQEFKIELGLSD